MTAEDSDGWSCWPAPAKLNLFLRVVGRREDGYHLLQTVFQLLDFGDTLRLRCRDDGRIERHGGPAGVDAEDDLVVRAARLLQQETGCRSGADIALAKRIPLGGGFGGGSSDAATVLRALDRIWRTGLSIERLAALGARLGADVPVFVRGHSAWAEGIGEQLTPLELPPRWYLLLDPGCQVATGALFQAPDLTRNAIQLKMADFDPDRVVGNAFESVVRSRVPRIDAALTALSRFGAATMTGTGSGCFVAFAGREAAESAAVALGRQWRVWLAAGVNRSALLERLDAYRDPITQA
jgi:4-diphosphocytidyl-2-C-methyl-D-erythritol kinase